MFHITTGTVEEKERVHICVQANVQKNGIFSLLHITSGTVRRRKGEGTSLYTVQTNVHQLKNFQYAFHYFRYRKNGDLDFILQATLLQTVCFQLYLHYSRYRKKGEGTLLCRQVCSRSGIINLLLIIEISWYRSVCNRMDFQYAFALPQVQKKKRVFILKASLHCAPYYLM